MQIANLQVFQAELQIQLIGGEINETSLMEIVDENGNQTYIKLQGD